MDSGTQIALDIRHLCQDLLDLHKNDASSLCSFPLLPLTSHWFHYLYHPRDLEHIQSWQLHNKRRMRRRLKVQRERARQEIEKCQVCSLKQIFKKKVFHSYQLKSFDISPSFEDPCCPPISKEHDT